MKTADHYQSLLTTFRLTAHIALESLCADEKYHQDSISGMVNILKIVDADDPIHGKEIDHRSKLQEVRMKIIQVKRYLKEFES